MMSLLGASSKIVTSMSNLARSWEGDRVGVGVLVGVWDGVRVKLDDSVGTADITIDGIGVDTTPADDGN